MRIIIETIPHELQRYDTVGDWRFEKNILFVTVSDLKNKDEEFLVAIHEAIEAWLCQKNGVKEEDVTRFDKKHLKQGFISEPGDDRDAPYHHEHSFATGVERLLAAEMNINWAEYDKKVGELDGGK